MSERERWGDRPEADWTTRGALVASPPRQQHDRSWLALRALFGVAAVLQLGFLFLIYYIAISNIGAKSAAPDAGSREVAMGPLLMWLVLCPILDLIFALGARRRSALWWIVGQACCFSLVWGPIASNLWDALQVVCLGLSLAAEASLIWPMAWWAVYRFHGRIGL